MTCQHRHLHSLNLRSLHRSRYAHSEEEDADGDVMKSYDAAMAEVGGAIERMRGADHDGEDEGERKQASRRDDDDAQPKRALVRPRVAIRQSASPSRHHGMHRYVFHRLDDSDDSDSAGVRARINITYRRFFHELFRVFARAFLLHL